MGADRAGCGKGALCAGGRPLSGRGGKCRFLPDPGVFSENQPDAIYSESQNIREQAENVAASCKTVFDTHANENPGALAGATGADVRKESFLSIEYRNRAEAATSLCLSIANCEPEDAVVILDAALADLRQKVLFDGNPHFRDAVAQYRIERNRRGWLA